MKANEAPEKLYISYEGFGVFGDDGSTEKTKISQIEYTRTDAFLEKACEWLCNYESIGLTKEHIKRLNNAINILESVHEYTDAKYIKEIKDKLLENADNNNAFVEKACEYLKNNCQRFILTEKDITDFKEYMKGE